MPDSLLLLIFVIASYKTKKYLSLVDTAKLVCVPRKMDNQNIVTARIRLFCHCLLIKFLHGIKSSTMSYLAQYHRNVLE